MGNPLLKQYSVDKEDKPVIDGSRFLRWKVYRGFDKGRALLANSSSSLAFSSSSSSSSSSLPSGASGFSSAASAARSGGTAGGGGGGGGGGVTGGAAAAAASLCSAVAAASFSSSAAFGASAASSGFAAAGGAAAAPGAAVSLFCFDKKLLLEPPFAQSAPLRAELLQLLHREALLLQRLRHPKLLHLLEPLQEDKHSLVFCTRFVHATLKQQLRRAAAASPAAPASFPAPGSAAATAVAPSSYTYSSNGSSNASSSCSSSREEERAGPAEESRHSCGGSKGAAGRRLSAAEETGGFSLLEIKAGLLDILEALQFLHADAQLVHLNIHFESIFLTSSGHWRLGGLAFAAEATGAERQTAEAPVSFTPYPDSLHAAVALGPPLYYSAPEAAQQRCCTAAADVFSLGLLMAELLAGGGGETAGSFKRRLVKCGEWDLQTHQAECDRLVPLAPEMFHASPYFQGAAAAAACSAAGVLPDAALSKSGSPADAVSSSAVAASAAASTASSSLSALLSLLNSMLQPDPRARPTAEQCMQAAFFQDLNVRALRFLESLHEKDEQQKIQFLKGFLPLLQQQEELHRVSLLRDRILKPLLDALIHPPLYPYVLPGLFFVLKKLDDREHFQRKVWPRVRPLLTAREIQVESVLLLVNELEFLMDMGTPEANQQDLLPLLAKCMQIPEVRIQEAVLERLCRVHGKFEYTVLRTVVLPRVLSLIQQTSATSTRVEGLRALAAMAGSFDRSTIINQVAPVIQQVTEADRSSAACLAVSAAVKALSQHVGLRLTVERLLQILFPLLMEEDLTVSAFYEINEVISFFLSKVLATREKQFTIKSEQASAVAAVLPPRESPGLAAGVHTPRGSAAGGGGRADASGEASARPMTGFLSSCELPQTAAGAATAVLNTDVPLEALLLTSFSAAAASGRSAGGGRAAAAEEAGGRSRGRGEQDLLPPPPPPVFRSHSSSSSNGAAPRPGAAAAAAGATRAAPAHGSLAVAPSAAAPAASSNSSAPGAAGDDLFLMSLAAAAAQLSAPAGGSSCISRQQQQQSAACCSAEQAASTDPWLGLAAPSAASSSFPTAAGGGGGGGATAARNFSASLQGSLSPLRAPPQAQTPPAPPAAAAARAAASNSYLPPRRAGGAAAAPPPPPPSTSSLSSASARRPASAAAGAGWASEAVSAAVAGHGSFLSPLPKPPHELFPPALPRQPQRPPAAAAPPPPPAPPAVAPLASSNLPPSLQQQQLRGAAAAAAERGDVVAADERNGSPASTTQSSSRANSCKNTYSLQDIFAACAPVPPSGPASAAATLSSSAFSSSAAQARTAAATAAAPTAAAAEAAAPTAAATAFSFGAWPASTNASSSLAATPPHPPPASGTFNSQLLSLPAGPAAVFTGRRTDDPFADLLPPASAAPGRFPANGGASLLPGSAAGAAGHTDKREQSLRDPFEKLGNDAAADFSRAVHRVRPHVSAAQATTAPWPLVTVAPQQNHQQRQPSAQGADPFSNLDSVKL